MGNGTRAHDQKRESHFFLGQVFLRVMSGGSSAAPKRQVIDQRARKNAYIPIWVACVRQCPAQSRTLADPCIHLAPTRACHPPQSAVFAPLLEMHPVRTAFSGWIDHDPV